MKYLFLLGIPLFLLMGCHSSGSSSDDKWEPLFNGKNLDGWDIKFTGQAPDVNYKNTFRVEDGLLKVRYDQYDSLNNVFGHLITQERYSHYKIRAEYRFVGEQIPGGADWAYKNNGLIIHSQPAKSMRKDQEFPVGVEVQLLGGDEQHERTNLNVCTPGTHVKINDQQPEGHCTNSSLKAPHGDQWVTVEVEVRGDSIIKHIFDDEVVLEYEKPLLDESSPDYKKLVSPQTGKRLTKGHIALQAESHPTDFRKVEIMVLEE
ncbi:MAG: 3-keto-disaccharide hydrolase [Bacteroidota bacterium]